MKKIRPPRIYATEEVFQDRLCKDRMQRMLAGIGGGSAERVTEAELNDLVNTNGWSSIKRWGEIESPSDPDIVFTTAKFHTDERKKLRREKYPNLSTRDLFGYHTFWFRPDGLPNWRREHQGIVCQPAYQLHSVTGCPFRCSYCSFGGLIRILLNLEEYCGHLDEWLSVAPAQRLYKWDNQSNVPCFEPEYGASKMLVEYFARSEEKCLEIYAGKSDNVDYLLDLDHNGHTIIQWSIGAKTQSTVFEKETASMEDRIGAASKCQEAGYTVRYRFSPIIPVTNWREENRQLIERIFAKTKPDVISLCAFGWMGLDHAKRCLDLSLVDEEFVKAMEGSACFLKERGYTSGGGHPIPHDARVSIFRFLIDEIKQMCPETIIALCLETEEMWTVFGEELGMGSNNYVCNCGPLSTPGAPLYEEMVKKRKGRST